MATSMLKTLAGKYHSSVSKMARKYKATVRDFLRAAQMLSGQRGARRG